MKEWNKTYFDFLAFLDAFQAELLDYALLAECLNVAGIPIAVSDFVALFEVPARQIKDVQAIVSRVSSGDLAVAWSEENQDFYIYEPQDGVSGPVAAVIVVAGVWALYEVMKSTREYLKLRMEQEKRRLVETLQSMPRSERESVILSIPFQSAVERGSERPGSILGGLSDLARSSSWIPWAIGLGLALWIFVSRSKG